VYYIGPENEETKIVYPRRLVARSSTGGCATMRSCLLRSTGSQEDLGRNGQYVLMAHITLPDAGHAYRATAALSAAESSTSANANVGTACDFTKSADALAYHIVPEKEEAKIVHPCLQFHRSIADGRARMGFSLTWPIGQPPGHGGFGYGKIYDLSLPSSFL